MSKQIIDVSSWQGPLSLGGEQVRHEELRANALTNPKLLEAPLKINRSLDDVKYGGLRASGVIGVIVKASEGLGYMDPKFVAHWKQADAAGLIVGSYHFARQENRPSIQGAINEADWYISCQRKCHRDGEAWKPGNFVPVLDFETGTADHKYSAWRDAFLGRIKAQTGHDGMLYTYTGFNSWLPPKKGQERFWRADYRTHPEMPAGYTHWDLWQYTSTARFSGVAGEVDASVLPALGEQALARIRCHVGDRRR